MSKKILNTTILSILFLFFNLPLTKNEIFNSKKGLLVQSGEFEKDNAHKFLLKSEFERRIFEFEGWNQMVFMLIRDSSESFPNIKIEFDGHQLIVCNNKKKNLKPCVSYSVWSSTFPQFLNLLWTYDNCDFTLGPFINLTVVRIKDACNFKHITFGNSNDRKTVFKVYMRDGDLTISEREKLLEIAGKTCPFSKENQSTVAPIISECPCNCLPPPITAVVVERTVGADATGAVPIANRTNEFENDVTNDVTNVADENITQEITLSVRDNTSGDVASSNVTSGGVTSSGVTSSDATSSNVASDNVTSSNVISSVVTFSNVTSSGVETKEVTYSKVTYSNVTYSNVTYSNVTSNDLMLTTNDGMIASTSARNETVEVTAKHKADAKINTSLKEHLAGENIKIKIKDENNCSFNYMWICYSSDDHDCKVKQDSKNTFIYQVDPLVQYSALPSLRKLDVYFIDPTKMEFKGHISTALIYTHYYDKLQIRCRKNCKPLLNTEMNLVLEIVCPSCDDENTESYDWEIHKGDSHSIIVVASDDGVAEATRNKLEVFASFVKSNQHNMRQIIFKTELKDGQMLVTRYSFYILERPSFLASKNTKIILSKILIIMYITVYVLNK